MFAPVQVNRLTRPSAIEGVEIVEFASESGLTCPYFHQRFFTHDGARFVCSGEFEGRTEAVLIEIDTGDAWRLTEGGAHVHTGDLAPDGRSFYFVRTEAIWSVDLHTGEERECWVLPQEDGYECLKHLHFSSDGGHIAIAGNAVHASGVKIGRIWTIPTADGTVARVIDRPFQIGHVQFSTADPHLLMYCHETGGAAPQRMWLARTDGQHPGTLFDDPGHPWVTHETFSGNGQWVVFVRRPEGLGVIRPDNSGFEPLEAPGAWHPGPTSDGTFIVHDTHSGEIRVHCRASGESLLVSASEMGDPPAHPHPRFGPDERTIIWTSSREGEPRPALADLTSVLDEA